MGMIHFVGGEKGGVGKSVMSRLLSQYFIDREQAYSGLDADQSHPTLTRYYGEFTKPINLDKFESIDQIVEEAIETNNSVLVDLPAQSQRFLDHWIDDNDVLEMCEEAEIPLVYWYVADDGRDSVQLLNKFLGKYGERLQCVVVKNHGCGSDFSELEELLAKSQEPAFQDLLQINLPSLHDSTMHKVDKLNFSFWAAANLKDTETPKLGLMERQRVKVWLKKSYGAFDDVFSIIA